MKTSKMLYAFAAAILVFSQFFPYPALADEYVVTGNGEGSENSISLEIEKSNTILQENTAEIENDVGAVAKTGEILANDNSGEVEITTGDIDESITVLNSGNTSEAEIGCCKSGPNDLGILDNGADSENGINSAQKSETTVTLSNNLRATNNISIFADTGENEASENGGDVVISSGEINLLARVLNQNLNSNQVKASSPDTSSNMTISGNGSDSKNVIDEEIEEENQFSITNSLILENNFKSFLNTGGNTANKNQGKVFISTGSIMLDLILENRINMNKLISGCCKKAGLSPSPSPSPSSSPAASPSPSSIPDVSSSPPSQGSCCTPTNDPPGPPGGSGGQGGGGEVLGATLPVTGGFSLGALTFFALLMLSFGIILRGDYAYGKTKFKKVFGQFNDSFRSYALGAYLFANLKSVSSGKA